MNDANTSGIFAYTNAAQNNPSGNYGVGLSSIFFSQGNPWDGWQLTIDIYNNIYTRTLMGGTWTSWSFVSQDIPSFYKDYNNLSALASALGVHVMTQITGTKSNIEVAKDCFGTMNENTWGLWKCTSTVDSNCYINIYKDLSATGLIEITTVSSGHTQRYKRGYDDSDFVLVP